MSILSIFDQSGFARPNSVALLYSKARSYSLGIGLPKDSVQANIYFLAAALHRHPSGLYRIGCKLWSASQERNNAPWQKAGKEWLAKMAEHSLPAKTLQSQITADNEKWQKAGLEFLTAAAAAGSLEAKHLLGLIPSQKRKQPSEP